MRQIITKTQTLAFVKGKIRENIVCHEKCVSSSWSFLLEGNRLECRGLMRAEVVNVVQRVSEDEISTNVIQPIEKQHETIQRSSKKLSHLLEKR